ncbi:hypothetical protein AVEN_84800-1 [Araneus ventricosus]|uniref:Uncharacterized protein n=1 Tax=Araneus ventricosus TaxID=182803 RepID=A0A4Y2WPT6_ARAVE|nr:hypothetical protein AVEN_195850-1 [Araneus ventricosus]GBO38452.1 hypothetical protein AVEN_265988-1 [Araneus ventricosus]GBO38453.1 hypothetical protein AVEN_67673-1 [Araneus ventricosus]GBO38454.1 hypothetical protein AVEN_84800-1 [Araneus ventricosus]
MFAKIVIICVVLAAAQASLIGHGRLGSPAIAAGGYGVGGRGVVAAPVGYAGHGAIAGRGIGGYGIGAPVAAAPAGYGGHGAIGGYGVGGTRSVGVVRGGIGAPIGVGIGKVY